MDQRVNLNFSLIKMALSLSLFAVISSVIYFLKFCVIMCFPWWLSDKESACQCRRPRFREETLEKEMATHSSILAWEIPWAEEPSGPQSMRSQRIECNIATKQQQQNSLVWLVSIVSNFPGPLIFLFLKQDRYLL